MMQFTFDVPFKFERLFNFDNPWLARNNYWVESDSNPDYIKQFTYSRKQTLVKKLEISSLFKGDRQDTERYLVTLTGVTGSNDVFYIPIKLLPKFLERFDLL
mgnify:FL=1